MALTSFAQKRLFILGSFVVVLLAVLLYWRINALIESFRQIDHANYIELNLQHVLSYITDAETGQRGFILTEDSSFLDPYVNAPERVKNAMAHVQESITKNPEQQQNFAWLQTLVNQRFALLDLT